MFWLLLILMAGYGLLLEMQLQFDLQHFDCTRARILLRVAGLERDWRFELARTPQGHRLLLADSHGTQQVGLPQIEESRAPLLLKTVARADRARNFLLRHLHLSRLDALILLRTEDAAGSAILSGVAQGVLACIPAAQRENVRVRVLPEFFRAHSTVNGRCIIRLRLGTFILTASMLLAARLRMQRLTESEAV